MRLYFMEFNTKGTDEICESHTADILTIEGKNQSTTFRQRVYAQAQFPAVGFFRCVRHPLHRTGN